MLLIRPLFIFLWLIATLHCGLVSKAWADNSHSCCPKQQESKEVKDCNCGLCHKLKPSDTASLADFQANFQQPFILPDLNLLSAYFQSQVIELETKNDFIVYKTGEFEKLLLSLTQSAYGPPKTHL